MTHPFTLALILVMVSLTSLACTDNPIETCLIPDICWENEAFPSVGSSVRSWCPGLMTSVRRLPCCFRESEVFCPFRWISTHTLCATESLCATGMRISCISLLFFPPSTISIKKRFKVEKCILIHDQRKSCAKAIIFRAYCISPAMQHDWVSMQGHFFVCLFCFCLEDIVLIDGGQHVNSSAWMHNFKKTWGKKIHYI